MLIEADLNLEHERIRPEKEATKALKDKILGMMRE